MERLKPLVVDTNVLLVASGMAEQANEKCIETCIIELQSIQYGGVPIVLDYDGLILDEYYNKLTPTGSRVGDIFLRFIVLNRFDPLICQIVEINPIYDHDGVSIISFDEFPNDPLLASFDISDRKFVAVAITLPAQPEILNAADSDWQAAEPTLNNYGVSVRFLCPELLV